VTIAYAAATIGQPPTARAIDPRDCRPRDWHERPSRQRLDWITVRLRPSHRPRYYAPVLDCVGIISPEGGLCRGGGHLPRRMVALVGGARNRAGSLWNMARRPFEEAAGQIYKDIESSSPPNAANITRIVIQPSAFVFAEFAQPPTILLLLVMDITTIMRKGVEIP
jgi:hypothetical protein